MFKRLFKHGARKSVRIFSSWQINVGVAFGFLVPFLKVFQKQDEPNGPEPIREAKLTIDVNAAEGAAIPDPSQRFFEFGTITVFDPIGSNGKSLEAFEQIYDPSSDRFDLELKEFNFENSFEFEGPVNLREDWVFSEYQVVMLEYAEEDDDFICYVLDEASPYLVLDDALAGFFLLAGLIGASQSSGKQFDVDETPEFGANNDKNEVAEAGSVSVSAEAGVLANDTLETAVSSLFVESFANGSTRVEAGDTFQGTYGTLTLGSDGSYIYTADTAAADALVAGAQVEDVFEYTVSDGAGASDTASLTITVTGENDAPDVTSETDFSAFVDEAGAYTLTTSDLYYTDVDDEASGVTFTVSSFVNGKIQVSGTDADTFTAADLSDGAVVFLHDGSETSEAFFDVYVEDGDEDGSVPSDVRFEFLVDLINDAPVAVDDLGGVIENETLTVDASSGVLSNDTDADSDLVVSGIAFAGTPGTVGADLEGTYGTLTLGSDGSYIYTADTAAADALVAGAQVEDVFEYTVSDGAGASDTASLTITVTGENEPSYLTVDMAAGPLLDGGSLALEAFGASGELLFSVEKDDSDYVVIDGSADAELLNGDAISSLRSISGRDVESIEEFQFEVNGYAGEIILRLAEGANFVDEATGSDTLTDVDLRAMGYLPFEGNETISITPFSEMAFQFIGKALGLSEEINSVDFIRNSENSSKIIENYSKAAELVQEVTGIDIIADRVIAANDSSRFRPAFVEDIVSPEAKQYGLKLAGLSQLYEGDSTGVGILSFVSQIDVTVSDNNILEFNKADAVKAKVILTEAQETFSVNEGFLSEAPGNSGSTPAFDSNVALIDGVAPVKATIESTAQSPSGLVAEGAVDLVDNLNSSSLPDYLELDVFFNDVMYSATYSAETGSYVSDNPDFEVVEFDSETGDATWRLTLDQPLVEQSYSLEVVVTDAAENSSLTSKTFDFSNDALPDVEITLDDPILISGDETLVNFAFSEEVFDFDVSDIEVSLGSVSNLVQDAEDPNLWTANLSVTSSESQLPLSLTLKENGVQDIDGNGNPSASALYAVLAASESDDQPGPTDDIITANLDEGIIHGLGGDDILIGASGADKLVGDEDDDLLIGGGDDDVLIGASGDDIIDGGAGADTYFFDAFEGNHNYQDIFIGGFGDDTVKFAADLESYQIGVVSSEIVELINGLISLDVDFRGIKDFDGFDENHPVFFVQKLGEVASESLYQSGYLQAEYFEFSDLTLAVDHFEVGFRGGDFPTDDVLTLLDDTAPLLFRGLTYANAISEGMSVLGGSGDDVLISGLGSDSLAGQQGADTLVSLGGNDHLYGDDGEDILAVLAAYQQDDISAINLEGGAGNDTFAISPRTADNKFNILISDFEIGSDVINFDGIYASEDSGLTLVDVNADDFLESSILDVQNQEMYIDLSQFYDSAGKKFDGSGLEVNFVGGQVVPSDINQDVIGTGLTSALESDWWSLLLSEHEYNGAL